MAPPSRPPRPIINQSFPEPPPPPPPPDPTPTPEQLELRAIRAELAALRAALSGRRILVAVSGAVFGPFIVIWITLIVAALTLLGGIAEVESAVREITRLLTAAR